MINSMQAGKKRISIWLTEIICLTALLVFAILIDYLIFERFSTLPSTVDIQVHDTYYVFSGRQWIVPFFVVSAVLTYAVKEGIRKYSYQLPNFILAGLLIALLFILLQWHQLLMMWYPKGGWTVYPPLDTPPEQNVVNSHLMILFWDKFLTCSEIILVIGLFALGFRTGSLKRKRTNSNYT